MGQEAMCEARAGGKTSTGKAQLETDALIFRGGFRLSIARTSIQGVKAEDGWLHVTYPEGTAAFELGARAAKWADKILHPPSLLDKLDVKPGMRVSLCGVEDASFGAQVRERAGEVFEGRAGKESDLIFFQAGSVKDLEKVKRLEGSLKRSGALWVVYPKGRKDITEADVFRAGKAAGLV